MGGRQRCLFDREEEGGEWGGRAAYQKRLLTLGELSPVRSDNMCIDKNNQVHISCASDAHLS